MAVDLKRRRDLRIGDLVLLRPVRAGRRGRGARLEVERSLGRPDVARDVVEALLYERGHHRRFPRAAESEAGRPPRRPGIKSLPSGPARPDRAPHLHDRSDQREGLRRRAVGRARRGRAAPARPHRRRGRRSCGPAGRWTREAQRRGNSVYVPGAVEPMLPHALSSEACSLDARRAAQRGHRRDLDRPGRAGAQLILLPQPDPLRRASRVRAGRPHLRRAPSRAPEAVAEPLALARGARRRAARGAAGARRPRRWRAPSRTSSSTTRATWSRRATRSRPRRTG